MVWWRAGHRACSDRQADAAVREKTTHGEVHIPKWVCISIGGVFLHGVVELNLVTSTVMGDQRWIHVTPRSTPRARAGQSAQRQSAYRRSAHTRNPARTHSSHIRNPIHPRHLTRRRCYRRHHRHRRRRRCPARPHTNPNSPTSRPNTHPLFRSTTPARPPVGPVSLFYFIENSTQTRASRGRLSVITFAPQRLGQCAISLWLRRCSTESQEPVV